MHDLLQLCRVAGATSSSAVAMCVAASSAIDVIAHNHKARPGSLVPVPVFLPNFSECCWASVGETRGICPADINTPHHTLHPAACLCTLNNSPLSTPYILTMCAALLCMLVQVPFTDGMSFLLDNLKRRPLVVVRSILAGLHDALRGWVVTVTVSTLSSVSVDVIDGGWE